jgi:predicted DNA-binding transcriptional regulator AlpA
MSVVQAGEPAKAVKRGDRFLSVRETCTKVGVKSRNTLLAMERTRGFPSSIPVHQRHVVYLESDVEAWMESIVASSRNEKPSKESK